MLPTWVKHRDGRLAPFDSDVISRNLYAAAQSLGQVDAFLIRELTDSIVHFLAQEDLPSEAPSELIDEVAHKVVAQFGQADLAAAFGRRRIPASNERLTLKVPFAPTDSPDDVAARAVEEYSLRTVYSPDVAAAHEQGLIHLGGLRNPAFLETVTESVNLAISDEPLKKGFLTVQVNSGRASGTIAVDGCEWTFRGSADIERYIRGLEMGAAAQPRAVDLHLNTLAPPSWQPIHHEPLFQEVRREPPSPPENWIEMIESAYPLLRPVFHWRAGDDLFCRWITRCRQPFGVVFERLHRAVPLAHGMTRERPATLTTVGIDLPQLLNRPEISCQLDVFLDKLPSLVRLAVGAAAQLRTWMRREQRHLSGFMLDRAAVRIQPRGLEIVLEQFLGVPTPITKPAKILAEKIIGRLAETLEAEARRTSLELIGMVESKFSPENPPSLKETFAALDAVGKAAAFSDGRSVVVRFDAVNDRCLEVIRIVAEETSLPCLDVVGIEKPLR